MSRASVPNTSVMQGQRRRKIDTHGVKLRARVVIFLAAGPNRDTPGG